MVVDDHAINSLRPYFDVAYEELKKEWESNQYERLSQCPSFKAVAAYQEAINVLHKGAHFPDAVEEQLEKLILEEKDLPVFKAYRTKDGYDIIK